MMAAAARALHGIELVVVGASAGGIEALSLLLADLPPSWRVPVLVVLHLPEGHDSHLVEVFRHRVAIAVDEARDKAPIESGTLYFAPPGYHLSVERDACFSLSCEAPVHYSRPSIDLLMISAADAYGRRVAGFLLTGANDDGAQGMQRIHQRGGLTAVQDPTVAQVPTMPQAAIDTQAPDFVLPLPELRDLLLQLDAHHAP